MPKKAKREKRKKASLKVLNKNSTLLIRQEFMDYDYLDQLSEKELQFLADFTDEYYNASVGKQSDNGKNNRFHKSKELVKECQTNNNKRNNDLYGKMRSKNRIVPIANTGQIIDDPDYKGSNKIDKNSVEDAVIDYIDLKNKKR
jgi:hypothetical protein